MFEHTFGYGGKKELRTNRQISKATRLSETRVRDIKKDIYTNIQAFEQA